MKKTNEELVDEMIVFTTKAGGNLDMYLGMCEKSVAEAKANLDGSEDMQFEYETALDFLRIATDRYDNE